MSKSKLIINGLSSQSDIVLINATYAPLDMYSKSILFKPVNSDIHIYTDSCRSFSVIDNSYSSSIVLFGSNPINVTGPNYIEVQNNSNLNIHTNHLPLEDIIATSGGTIQLSNNYTGNIKTTIQIGNNSTVSLTGIELPLERVIMEKDAIFGFIHNNTMMQINTLNNSINTQDIVIEDIHRVADCAIYLSTKFNSNNPHFGLNELDALRFYDKNREVFKLFIEQNNMSYTSAQVEEYIATVSSEINSVAKDLNQSHDIQFTTTDETGYSTIGGTNFQIPAEIMGQILYHVHSDIKLH